MGIKNPRTWCWFRICWKICRKIHPKNLKSDGKIQFLTFPVCESFWPIIFGGGKFFWSFCNRFKNQRQIWCFMITISTFCPKKILLIFFCQNIWFLKNLKLNYQTKSCIWGKFCWPICDALVMPLFERSTKLFLCKCKNFIRDKNFLKSKQFQVEVAQHFWKLCFFL